MTGCDELSLGEPTFTFAPEGNPAKIPAASPAAFSGKLTLPQDGLIEPEALATPPLEATAIPSRRG